MKRLALLTVAALALATAAASDAAVLTLTAPTTSVAVNQPVTVQVSLSGLADGEALDFLGATIDVSKSLFALPATPAAGAIVPAAGLADFDADVIDVPAEGKWEVSAFYISLDGSNLVTANGTFYTFELIPTAEGTLTLDFLPDSLMATTAPNGDALSLTAGTPLQLTVSVPEPAVVLPLLVSTILLPRRRRA